MRRPTARWAAFCGVLALALAVLGTLVVVQHREAGSYDEADGAAQAGEEALERLVSFKDGRAQAELQNESEVLTDDFAAEYAASLGESVGTDLERAKISVTAEVVDIAVSKVDGNSVRLLGYLTVTRTAPGEASQESTQMVSVAMLRVGDAWLVDGLEAL